MFGVAKNHSTAALPQDTPKDPFRAKRSDLAASGSYQAPPAVFGGKRSGAAGVDSGSIKKHRQSLSDSDSDNGDNGDNGTRTILLGGFVRVKG